MDLCPLCLENNKHSFLGNVGVDTKLLVCESDGCIYLRIEGESNLCNENGNDNSLNEKQIKLFSNDSIDLECDLSTTTDSDSEYTSFTNKSKLTFCKYKIITVQRHLSQLIKEADKKDSIFNWLGFPLMLKFHLKMCFFLVINLHLFNANKHKIIHELKELYYQCENTVCKIPNRLVSLISFKFLNVLYEQHDRFKLASFTLLDMSERIVKSMNNFISGLNDSITYKSVFSFRESCRSCGIVFTFLREDFTVKLLGNFEYSDYTFGYVSKCRKCFTPDSLQVDIKIERLANFIFIVCPEGVNKTATQLKEIVFKKPFDHNLKLQAIIELNCPASFNDVPEKEPKFEEFIMKNACKLKVEFRIHFRNTVGWYCIDTNSGTCIDPISETDIRISPSKVRFLIYGELNDPINSHANEFYPPIFNVLEQFKKPPKGCVKYPSEIIKYWMILFKYRDYCLQKNDFSKSFITKMSSKITGKLNSHLKRRQNRIKKKLKEAMKNDLINGSQVLFDYSIDEEENDVEGDANQFNEEQEEQEEEEAHDVVTWHRIKSSEDLLKHENQKEDEERDEEEAVNHDEYLVESSSNSASNCPVIVPTIVKREESNYNNDNNDNNDNNNSQNNRKMFDILKCRTENVRKMKMSNEISQQNIETNILLDKMIEMKKRKLDQRDEDLYNI